MATIQDVMVYITKVYPLPEELSKARLTKLIYLADWKHTLTTKKQITEINWYFDNYGPYVSDIHQVALNNTDIFEIEDTTNYFGGSKTLIKLKPKSNFHIQLEPTEVDAIKFAIEKTKYLNWDGFIKLIYSTYPVVSSEKYSTLDLISKAEEYQSV